MHPGLAHHNYNTGRHLPPTVRPTSHSPSLSTSLAMPARPATPCASVLSKAAPFLLRTSAGKAAAGYQGIGKMPEHPRVGNPEKTRVFTTSANFFVAEDHQGQRVEELPCPNLSTAKRNAVGHLRGACLCSSALQWEGDVRSNVDFPRFPPLERRCYKLSTAVEMYLGCASGWASCPGVVHFKGFSRGFVRCQLVRCHLLGLAGQKGVPAL